MRQSPVYTLNPWFAFVLSCVVLAGVIAPSRADDLRTVVKEAYRDRINDLTTGIYCKALSCKFDIDSFAITETAPSTYRLETTAWLEGTIPGLKGSAKRTVSLTGSYTKGTCIIKDVKALSDVTESNNGWGSSKIAGLLKTGQIAPNLFLEPEDCKKADIYLTRSS